MKGLAYAQFVQYPIAEKLTQSLPEAFKSSLPSIEEIETELAGELGEGHE